MELLNPELIDKISDAFHMFTSGRLPNDDALLEKLLTWSRTHLNSYEVCERFITDVGLTKCWESCISNSQTVPTEAWSFVLRLSGHLAGHVIGNVDRSQSACEFVDMVRLLLDKSCTDDTLWNQSSVRVAWLLSLSLSLDVCGNSSSLVTSSVVDYLQRIGQCTTDSSWFVSQAALSVITKMIELYLSDSSGVLLQSSTTFKAFATGILKPLTDPSHSTPHGCQQLSVALEVIRTACTRGDGFFTLLGMTPEFLVTKLCDVLKTSACRQMPDLVRMSLDILGLVFKTNMCVNIIEEQTCLLVTTLLEEKDIILAINISSWGLSLFTSEKSVHQMNKICWLPIMAMDCGPLSVDEKSDKVGCLNIEALKNDKALHLSALKLSLSHLEHLNTKSDVLRSLSTCVTSSFEPGNRVNVLAANSRLRLWCLDAFGGLLKSLNQEELYVSLDLFVMVTEKSLQDHSLLSKAMTLSLQCLQLLPCDADLRQPTRTSWTDILQKSLCSTNWNVRDTALEFLQKIFTLSSGIVFLQKWTTDLCLHHLAWQSAEDAESYVRASAVSAVGAVYVNSILWQDFMLHCVPEDDVLRKIIDLCRHDVSEFVRRAAVGLLSRWHCNADVASDVLSTLHDVVISDVDWEVKRCAVQFWHSMALDILRQTNIPNIDYLMCSSGCLSALLTAATDCDRTVRLAALEALVDVQKTKMQCDSESSSLTETTKKHSSCNDRTDLFANTSLKVGHQDWSDPSSVLSLHSSLMHSDWLSQLAVESRSTDDCYTDSPNSLLDDVLKSADVDDDAEPENVVDCY